MKRSTIPRLLALLVLLVLGVVVGAVWLLGTRWGQQRVAELVRERVARQSALVLAPFEVRFSLLRDFPHLTASVHNFSLTDTSFRRAVPVLRVRRADARLEVGRLWRGEFRVSRLTVRDAHFQQFTDSLGHDWGLRGRGPRRHTPKAPPSFELDSLVLLNAHFSDRNELHHSGFAAHVQRGSLHASVHGGRAHVRGRLQGVLNTLYSGRGPLFEQKPVAVQIHYQYLFRQRRGTFLRTTGLLNGDTLVLTGSHQGSGPGQPRGTQLNLRFVGQQPLLEVLRVAFPPGLDRYLNGARSPSHARIWYRIRGLSGPTTRPRTVLRFALHRAQVQWADSARRIQRWDAQGVFDNGPDHNARTTSLRFDQCRLYSRAGQLDARLRVTDFTHPHIVGHLRGRTELRTLATVLLPRQWRARGGQVALHLDLDGTLPVIPRRRRRAANTSPLIAVQGTMQLENASLVIPGRGADFQRLNVGVRLRNRHWDLVNLKGQLNGMQVQANATTTDLLAYFSGHRPSTSIAGTFAVDELRLPELRRLLAPPARPKPRRRPAAPATGAYRALNLLPPGLHLNIELRCGRLVLATDTLLQLAATIQHDGQRVQLSDLRGQAWGGTMRGAASWLTDSSDATPVAARLNVHFHQLSYQRLLTRVIQAPRRAARAPADPSLRELLLAANGEVEATVERLLLPGGDQLSDLQLRMEKLGPDFRIPELTFRTSTGGEGQLDAALRLQGHRLLAAHANLRLRYQSLDVQQLLQLLAALSTVPEPPPGPRRRATRPRPPVSPFLDGTVTGRVQVEAENIRYGVLQGEQFRVRSSLVAGKMLLEEGSLQALGGQLHLRGQLQTVGPPGQRRLHTQLRLEHLQLPDLFGLAEKLGLDVLSPANIRGTMNSEADVYTTLDATFLPRLSQTHAFLRTDLRALELLEVEPIMQALRPLRKRRTGHLYFEPVRSRFILDGTRLLIPGLSLSSNLTDMTLSGEYGLNGQADLYVGLSPMQTLFGDNRQRVSRVQTGEADLRRSRGLVYLSLHRTLGSRYQVRPFQKKNQRRNQEEILQEFRRQIQQQQLDTTLTLLP